MWLLPLFLLGAVPAWAENLGELSENPAGLSGSSGSFGFFGYPISQPNERNKPNKQDKPVWSLPTAAACGLKGAA
jgi:hypothetical protein